MRTMETVIEELKVAENIIKNATTDDWMKGKWPQLIEAGFYQTSLLGEAINVQAAAWTNAAFKIFENALKNEHYENIIDWLEKIKANNQALSYHFPEKIKEQYRNYCLDCINDRNKIHIRKMINIIKDM